MTVKLLTVWIIKDFDFMRLVYFFGIRGELKLGHGNTTDYTARFIRYDVMTRAVRDFCKFTGYTDTEFWQIVDKLYNREIFEKDEFGTWVLKNPIWEE